MPFLVWFLARAPLQDSAGDSGVSLWRESHHVCFPGASWHELKARGQAVPATEGSGGRGAPQSLSLILVECVSVGVLRGARVLEKWHGCRRVFHGNLGICDLPPSPLVASVCPSAHCGAGQEAVRGS